MKNILVIGAVAAGTKAASKARRESMDVNVTVLTRDEYISYAGCGLPYYIGDVIKSKDELLVKTPEAFKKEFDIDVLTHHEAIDILPEAKKVVAKDLKTDKIKEFKYDKLILATGASPFVPPIKGVELNNIFTLRTVSEAIKIKQLINTGKVKNAVVVGGGFIGLEVAENLTERGIKTAVVELLDHVLPMYDKEMALLVQNELMEHGVDVITGEAVEAFEGDSDGNVKYAITPSKKIPADMVIMSVGVRPNTELAQKAGIELGDTRAIKVNHNMETNIEDIYAVGDCAENINLITGKPAWFPMGSTSNKTGRIAAINLFAENAERDELRGVLGTNVVKVFNMNAAKTGLTEREAVKEGFDVETVIVPADDRAHYYPGYKKIVTKLIADRKSHRVLGAQIVGEGVVDKPIDIIAAAITFGARVDDLAKLDLAYAPPFSSAMSSTITTANVWLNKVADKVKGISPIEAHEKLSDKNVMFIDIRAEEEYMVKTIPGAVNIPKGRLKKELKDTPKDREIILICNVGKNAYLAYLTLKHMGFEKAAILEGGINAYPYELQ